MSGKSEGIKISVQYFPPVQTPERPICGFKIKVDAEKNVKDINNKSFKQNFLSLLMFSKLKASSPLNIYACGGDFYLRSCILFKS